MPGKVSINQPGKFTIAQILAKEGEKGHSPLYDEHVFTEPYQDSVRKEIERREQQRERAEAIRALEAKEQEMRLQEQFEREQEVMAKERRAVMKEKEEIEMKKDETRAWQVVLNLELGGDFTGEVGDVCTCMGEHVGGPGCPQMIREKVPLKPDFVKGLEAIYKEGLLEREAILEEQKTILDEQEALLAQRKTVLLRKGVKW